MLATLSQDGLAGAFAATLELDVRRMLRNRRYLMFSVGFPVLFYLLYSRVLGGGNANRTVDGVTWSAFFMVSMAAYGALGAALSSAVVIAAERTSGWTLQLRTTPLPPTAYLASKLLTSFLTTIPALALVMIAAVLVNGVRLQPAEWLQLSGSLAAGALPFAALGVLLGYLFDTSSVLGGMMVTYFLLAILGGLWAPLSNFPQVLVTIGHVLPSYHFANLGWDALAGHAPRPDDAVVLALYLAAFAVAVLWRYRADAQRAHA